GIRDRNVTGVQTCALPIFLLDDCALDRLLCLPTLLRAGADGRLAEVAPAPHLALTPTPGVLPSLFNLATPTLGPPHLNLYLAPPNLDLAPTPDTVAPENPVLSHYVR